MKIFLVCFCGSNPNQPYPVGGKSSIQKAEQLIVDEANKRRAGARVQLIRKMMTLAARSETLLPICEFGLPPESGNNASGWCYWQIFGILVDDEAEVVLRSEKLWDE